MVELQQTTYRIPGDIFCMKVLFPECANKVDLYILIAYKSRVDLNAMYLHEYMKQPNSNGFKKYIKKEYMIR